VDLPALPNMTLESRTPEGHAGIDLIPARRNGRACRALPLVGDVGSCDRGPMPTRLVHLVVDAADPAGLARFWSVALEWPVTFEEPDEVVIEPPDDDPAQAGQLPLVFVPVPEAKMSKNRVHLDVASTSEQDKAALVARLEGLGARQLDIGQPDDVSWVVMADPEGNEFCVLTPRSEQLPSWTATTKMRTILRIAALPRYRSVCLSPTGSVGTVPASSRARGDNHRRPGNCQPAVSARAQAPVRRQEGVIP
jgi:hypothetical protein